jgi:hypothetical protein
LPRSKEARSPMLAPFCLTIKTRRKRTRSEPRRLRGAPSRDWGRKMGRRVPRRPKRASRSMRRRRGKGVRG